MNHWPSFRAAALLYSVSLRRSWGGRCRHVLRYHHLGTAEAAQLQGRCPGNLDVHFTGAYYRVTDAEKLSVQEAAAETKDFDGRSIQVTNDESVDATIAALALSRDPRWI
jgi:hypothetical protein